MTPTWISFDAAGTLIEVNWRPAHFAVENAQQLGWDFDAQVGLERYQRLLGSRRQAYCEVNRTKDEAKCDAFWRELAEDWAQSIGVNGADINQLVDLALDGLYGAEQRVFSLYEDVLPVLLELRRAGARMVVLSNWDYSLHRVLRTLGIDQYFEFVFASLQEGPEKPDPALFEIVCARIGAAPHDILHIGDDPIDDFHGAKEAGLHAFLLDRSLRQSRPPTLARLLDLPSALAWHD